ncbi:MAG: ribonuclease [Sphingomonadaceae bacterium]|nr:ribonuclease [Sphingomonadaceae bacterium]
MAEWLYEAGIGEERAALVEDGAIVEARIEPERETARAGAIIGAKLSEITAGGRCGKLTIDNGEEALIEPAPTGVTEGASLFVKIARERIVENWGVKLAKAKHRPEADEARAALSLRQQLSATGHSVRDLASHHPDTLEEAGWYELLEQARSGVVRFSGGALRISLTPAMTVIDVDGALPPAELAVAGARAGGGAIRRFGIAGSIGIDLPTLEAKGDRQAAAAALDETLPRPFERTAVNGFGFLQIVRRHARPSLLELAQSGDAGFATCALLRRAERSKGKGDRTISAHPAIIGYLENKPEWLAALERRLGAGVKLQSHPAIALHSGEISATHP